MIRIALISLALASPAGAFELGFPLDCDLGQTCYIQQYSDHDPSPAAQDFTCGLLSYDGHDGTDFALPTRTAMEQGVAVLAAQAGRVTSLRDGVPDFAPVIAGKECGNGVVLDHGDGWETQYCHLKQGSVTVSLGQSLPEGAILGQVGQSGLAEFPHLHLSLRHKGETIDPFAPSASTLCGMPGDDLWQQPLPYSPGGLLGIGLAPEIPDYTAIKSGLPSPDLPATAPALVIWSYFYGTRAGDALLFEIAGPDGYVIRDRIVLEKTQALGFRAVGKRLKSTSWPEGRYSGTARLLRGATELGQQSIQISLTR